MPSPAGIAHALSDPLAAILQLLTGVLAHVVSTARLDLDGELTRYLFSTVDPTAPARALTANPTVAHLNGSIALAADALVGGVVLFTSLRSMFEHHSLFARYQLKLVLPRLLVAIVLVHGSLLFAQMAIDLNNALGGVALEMGATVDVGTLPWSASLDPATVQAIQVSQDLFQAIFAIALVIALVILVLAYVVRTALLEILLVIAPLAALCTVLPDTRGYARLWLRLFMVTVFMQAVQLIVLRVATAAGFAGTGGIAQSLYALATLWIVLKVPSALNSASHFETRAHSIGRQMERSVRRAMAPVHHAVHHRASV